MAMVNQSQLLALPGVTAWQRWPVADTSPLACRHEGGLSGSLTMTTRRCPRPLFAGTFDYEALRGTSGRQPPGQVGRCPASDVPSCPRVKTPERRGWVTCRASTFCLFVATPHPSASSGVTYPERCRLGASREAPALFGVSLLGTVRRSSCSWDPGGCHCVRRRSLGVTG